MVPMRYGGPANDGHFRSGRVNEWNKKLKPAINPPPSDETSQTNYLAACLFALEPSIESVLAAALKSGWKHDYVLMAIITIAMNNDRDGRLSSGLLHS